MSNVNLATVWLDGCSGCHMSFLDIDERLLDLGERINLVYSPLVDHKEFPDHVDVTIVEGAVSSTEDLEKIRHIRKRTGLLIALGDCAVTSNVPGMRNPFSVEEVLARSYLENAQKDPHIPTEVIPPLLPTSRPIHEFVKVDVFLPGCPPPADLIFEAITKLLDGEIPTFDQAPQFG